MMDVTEAVKYVNENGAVIHNAALLGNEAAKHLRCAFACYAGQPHVVTSELLICAVQIWIEHTKNGKG